jgi:tetratricopeptide (TPR) repeat protein
MSSLWKEYFAGNHEAVMLAGATAAETMHITGLSLIAVGRYEEATTLLMASALVSPKPEWYSNACVAFLDAGEPKFALTFALTGIADFSQNADVCFNAGNIFTALGNHNDAIGALEKALQADPSHWEAAMNLANAKRRVGQLTEALTYYDMAAGLNHTDIAGKVRTKLNKAVTLSDLGEEAIALRMLEELSDGGFINSPEMDFNRATLKLKLGDYENGWELYKSRWSCSMAKPDVEKFQCPVLSTLQEGIGKHVLFCHEQGFGDSIQFVRYAPLLQKAGIKVTILVLEPLKRLFECFGLPVVTEREGLDYDFECPMLNAPALFGTTLETIPSNIPYITVPNDLIESRKLPDTGKLKIGIVWAGQSREALEMKLIDQRRSIDIQLFKDILEIDADFYSLQFGERADDFKILSRNHPKKILSADFDFMDTASVIMNLDLVIAVDTSTAHLAATLGKPVWLLSRFDGCWRWLKDRTDSPWYFPNLRIFQQKTRLDWVPVLKDVEDALRSLI